MKEELALKLNADYPEIFLFYNFRGKGYFVFECGDGWYNILNTLFAEITHTIKHNNTNFNRVMEAQDMIDNGYMEQVPSFMRDRIEALKNGNGNWPEEMEFPVVQQVKEKFGTLNVYVKGWDERIQDLISFAEAMSATTCEECGNVGKTRGGNWIKTLCDKHYEEREAKLAAEAKAREEAAEAWIKGGP
jgi:hypothetical protein